MTYRSFVGALAGAAAGAIIWAVLCAATEYEIGFVAWGVGALVGGISAALGGSGSTNGALCAVLALVAIFVGKLVTIHIIAPDMLREMATVGYTQDYYDEMVSDAADFAQLTSRDDYPEFMVSHEYTEAGAAEDVTEEEVSDFETYIVQDLVDLHQNRPPYEQWHKEKTERDVARVMKSLPTGQMVIESLGLFDVLFALLGLGTAYKLGAQTES